jgi:hypothetical protein
MASSELLAVPNLSHVYPHLSLQSSPPFSKVSSQDGLEWEADVFGSPDARWTREPDTDMIAKIARRNLSQGDGVHVDVDFHAKDVCNKIYKISAAGSSYIMRVLLPVYPRLETDGKVATVNFVRRETTIPVPHVLAFDSSTRMSSASSGY